MCLIRSKIDVSPGGVDQNTAWSRNGGWGSLNGVPEISSDWTTWIDSFFVPRQVLKINNFGRFSRSWHLSIGLVNVIFHIISLKLTSIKLSNNIFFRSENITYCPSECQSPCVSKQKQNISFERWSSKTSCISFCASSSSTRCVFIINL